MRFGRAAVEVRLWHFGDMEGLTRFQALDQCIHCKTCAGVCETVDTYCPVLEPGGSSACIP